MSKIVRKSIDFPSDDKYLEIKVEATKKRQTIGEFILEVFEFWKNHQKSD